MEARDVFSMVVDAGLCTREAIDQAQAFYERQTLDPISLILGLNVGETQLYTLAEKHTGIGLAPLETQEASVGPFRELVKRWPVAREHMDLFHALPWELGTGSMKVITWRFDLVERVKGALENLAKREVDVLLIEYSTFNRLRNLV